LTFGVAMNVKIVVIKFKQFNLLIFPSYNCDF